MGKGDVKTFKGKLFRKSFGNKRKRKKPSKEPYQKKFMRYSFVTKSGKTIDGTQMVFPIITRKPNGSFVFLATGFFINSFGGLVTAKHVIFENDKQIEPLYVVHALTNDKYIIREVESVNTLLNSDAAVCMLKSLPFEQKGQLISNHVLAMSKTKPNIGDEIKTFAYPRSKIIPSDNDIETGEFSADWFKGKIVEYFPEGRDKTFLPGPCYQTSVKVLGGASGGPVMNANGLVIGINSTGYDFEETIDDESSISFITPIEDVFKIKVPIGKDKFATIAELGEMDSVRIE